MLERDKNLSNDESASLAIIRETFFAERKLAEAGKAELPIYRCLEDCIRSLIKQGSLAYGLRLPTISALASGLDLAKGTVTRAYKDLEREGYLSLTQGRGSFVNYDLRAEKANEPSRKEVATNAIEKLLSELQNLNFSRREMQIFLDLKMREFFEEKSYAQVAVISDTWEDRSILYKELGDYSHVQFNFFSIIDVLQGEIDPGSFRAFFITEDVYEIAKLHLNLNESRFIRPVCFKLSEHSLIELATLPQNNRVGILCYSERFGKQMQDSLEEFSGLASSAQVQLLRRPGLETLLENCQIVIFPYSCFIYLADKEKVALDSFISKGGKLLDYRMVPERASILNIRTCIEALADYGKEHL